MRILVIEDEPKLAKAVKEGLEADDYAVSLALTGEDGFYQLCRQTFDLAILDVMLPGRDGFEILKSVRQMHLTVPILLLTARDAVETGFRASIPELTITSLNPLPFLNFSLGCVHYYAAASPMRRRHPPSGISKSTSPIAP